MTPIEFVSEVFPRLGHITGRSSTDHDLDLSRKIDNIFPILYDLYDLAHVAGWDPYNPHDDLDHVSWVGSALQGRFCTTLNNGR